MYEWEQEAGNKEQLFKLNKGTSLFIWSTGIIICIPLQCQLIACNLGWTQESFFFSFLSHSVQKWPPIGVLWRSGQKHGDDHYLRWNKILLTTNRRKERPPSTFKELTCWSLIYGWTSSSLQIIWRRWWFYLLSGSQTKQYYAVVFSCPAKWWSIIGFCSFSELFVSVVGFSGWSKAFYLFSFHCFCPSTFLWLLTQRGRYFITEYPGKETTFDYYLQWTQYPQIGHWEGSKCFTALTN